MSEKSFKLFREKSIESIQSPESMNDYLHVTSPGVWIVLAAVVLILIGTCIWGVFGRIETQIRVAVVSRDGECYCVIPHDAMESVMKNGVVTVEDKSYAVDVTEYTADVITEETNVYTRLAGDYQLGDVVYAMRISEVPEDGIYSGILVTESLRPMSLLLN